MSHTGAARAAVANLTKSLAIEWAPFGVRVNAIAPGVVYSSTAAANYKDSSLLMKAAPIIPAKRLGSLEEVNRVYPITVTTANCTSTSFLWGTVCRGPLTLLYTLSCGHIYRYRVWSASC